MRLLAWALALCFSAVAVVWAQDGDRERRQPDQEQREEDAEAAPVLPAEPEGLPVDRRLLAISARSYPVTPGDVYLLEYELPDQLMEQQIVVQSDYSVDLRVFGTVDAEGLVFSELKQRVEGMIERGYPRSAPSLSLESIGNFQVLIRGAVPRTRLVTAWGLSRLNDVVEDNLARYSSRRNVEVLSRDGSVRTYDLQRAMNEGIVEENPLVRPGDVVTIARVDIEVELRGEVYAPGVYQVSEEESLADAIRSYGRGFTRLSDRSRIQIRRVADGPISTLTVDAGDQASTFSFRDGDVVVVPSKDTRKSVVYFEGGVSVPPETDESTAFAESVDGYNRVTYRFSRGETLYDALNAMLPGISQHADLRAAHVVRRRDREILQVDMDELLFAYDEALDVALEPFDRIVIPVYRPTVTVTGAVTNAGQFPYNPGQPYSYYIGLAGGIDTEMNRNGAASVKDATGKDKALDSGIEPGDTVYVHRNSFLYNFNRYFPLVTSALTLVTAAFSIYSFVDGLQQP